MLDRPVRLAVLMCLFAAPLATFAQQVRIVDKPICYDQERIALTLEYRRQHQGGDPSDVKTRVGVRHCTATNSFD